MVRTLPTTTTTVDDRNENKACCAGAGLTLAGVFWAVVTYTAATQIINPPETVDCRNSPVRWRHPYHWFPVPCAGCWSVPGPAQGRHQCLEARCLELQHTNTTTRHMQQFYLHTTPPDQGYRGQYHTLCVIDIDLMHSTLTTELYNVCGVWSGRHNAGSCCGRSEPPLYLFLKTSLLWCNTITYQAGSWRERDRERAVVMDTEQSGDEPLQRKSYHRQQQRCGGAVVLWLLL